MIEAWTLSKGGWERLSNTNTVQNEPHYDVIGFCTAHMYLLSYSRVSDTCDDVYIVHGIISYMFTMHDSCGFDNCPLSQ